MGAKKGTRPPNAGIGRAPGVPNKTTTLLKDAILKAAEAAGNKAGREGMVGYLTQQAEDNPGPFMALLGKVLPMQIANADAENFVVEIRRTLVRSDHSNS